MFLSNCLTLRGLGTAALLCAPLIALATTPLADKPVFASVSVPGNLALTVSVEFPTAISVAHPDRSYASTNRYVGYFDPEKCYEYRYTDGTGTDNYFFPSGAASNRTCTGKWSGNFLNWATMQTIDPFRWALTGGYRVIDTADLTVLEKAWSTNQGSNDNFPNSTLPTNAAVIGGATPFAGKSRFEMAVRTYGNRMRFVFGNGGNATNNATHFQGPAVSATDGTTYEVFVRVRVCDSSAAAGPLETNCARYPNGNYKPIGLLQEYSERIRFSVFGYLNDSNVNRDGGVLRAKQKFIGLQQPVPASTPVPTSNPEWDANTGVMLLNPNPSEASATQATTGVSVSNSGVLNYVNKFGQITPGSYKTYDPVGELYYAALRYYRNLGNVPEWSNMGTANLGTKTTWVDGFPVITDWDDPIQYSCQKNFILGIGDVNTHADRNLPGATGNSEPSKPARVSADTSVNAVTATNKVGVLHGLGTGLGNTQNYNGCCTNNGALMAGLAYDANATDIRLDMNGRQSVQTYWLDVLEYRTYKRNNQFYLAAKYGGFTVPEGFDAYARATDIPQGWWRTNNDTVGGSQPRPDNYFTADRADQMVDGLNRAFASIALKLAAYSSAFATALPQVATSGTAAYASQYDAGSWTGDLTASAATYDPDTGAGVFTQSWRLSTRLEAQAASGGWDTGRRIVTRRTDNGAAVPFRADSLPAEQLAKLDTAYRSGNDAGDYLNYLRGDRTHETTSSAAGSARAYRGREFLVGDIVNSKPLPVPPPSFSYSDSANPGYSTFRSTPRFRDRPVMVYFGTNQGMVHGINGNLTGSDAGREVFAYVPSALFDGPTGTPATNGLASLGNPTFVHYNMVDSPPVYADVDLGRTAGGSGTDWRTLLIGGLGKGGRSYYAIDISDPATMSTESAVASKVMWEFTHPLMGYSYGEPAVVKTRRYGWVVLLSSGHNNSDGKGYIFVVNPRTGELLGNPIATGQGSTSNQAGLSAIQAFIPDLSDGTADAVYAGDLLGNLWRVDLTPMSGDYPVTHLARLTDSSGNSLPVTARPLVVIQPDTLKRWVTVGTGRLLSALDLNDRQGQRFFAIMDGVNARPWTESELPDGMSYPITTSKLRQLTDIRTRINLDLATEIGWYFDLGTAPGSGPGWRVISDSTSYAGIVAFSAMLPSSTDICNPTGSGRVYAMDLGTGSTRITRPEGYDASSGGVVVDLKFRRVCQSGNNCGSGVGTVKLDKGIVDGSRGNADIDLRGSGNTLRQLNWREVAAPQ